MCTKEIAALATVMLLALSTAASMMSLAGLGFWLMPREVPTKSVLASFDWKQPSPEELVDKDRLYEWEHSGYTVFREAIDPRAIELLLKEAKRLCGPQFWFSRVCQVEEGRWQSDLIRDFLFHSNVSDYAAKLIRDRRDPPLRVYQDGIVGITSSWFQPLFYTFTKHVDHGGVPGMWHGLHSDSRGVGFWIPLVEIDPNVTGGGIELYEGYPQNGCAMLWGEKSTVDGFDATINMSKIEANCKAHQDDTTTTKPHVKPGDVIAWWPQMMHKTQPIIQKGFTRYALYVRVVSNETMVCMQKDCGWKGRPCCSGTTPKSGTMIKTPCFPQVWPKPLEQEVKAHMVKKPQPMLDRKAMVSKYSQDVWGTMHAVCKKHRQGGPHRHWAGLKNEAPTTELYRFPTLTTRDFDCEHAEHEGSCWVLYDSGLKWEIVPWYAINSTKEGFPLWFSKDLDDVESNFRIPWGTTVRGLRDDEGWIKIGDFYTREELFGARLHPADFMETSGKLNDTKTAEAPVAVEAEASPVSEEPSAEPAAAAAEPAHSEL